jgi:hypothetical protein
MIYGHKDIVSWLQERFMIWVIKGILLSSNIISMAENPTKLNKCPE